MVESAQEVDCWQQFLLLVVLWTGYRCSVGVPVTVAWWVGLFWWRRLFHCWRDMNPVSMDVAGWCLNGV